MITFYILAPLALFSQGSSINYFGQTPPGDSAVIFSPDFISPTTSFNSGGSFSPDGTEFCFATDIITGSKLMVTKYINGEWSEPNEAGFLGNNISYSTGGFYSPDGTRLFLHMATSTQAAGIWSCEKNGNSWENPVRLPDNINSLNVGEPFVAEDNTVFFAGANGIAYSKADDEYKTLHSLTKPVNFAVNKDFDPCIAPDKSYLIFASKREATYSDLYISYKKEDGNWTNPKNLGPKINSEYEEFIPHLTPDGDYLLFSRIVLPTLASSRIYWVNTSFINNLKLTNFEPYILNNIPDQDQNMESAYSYTISDSTFIDDDGNETLTFTASLNNGNDLPEFLTFDPESKTLSGQLSTIGSYEIKITATDTAGTSAFEVFILNVKQPNSIIDKKNMTPKIYPNPSRDKLFIDNPEIYNESASYRIISLTGKEVQKGKINSNSIDVSNLKRGVYFIKITKDAGTVTRKIIIQ